MKIFKTLSLDERKHNYLIKKNQCTKTFPLNSCSGNWETGKIMVFGRLIYRHLPQDIVKGKI